MSKHTPTETPSINVVGQGTSIKGDVVTNGDIRIDGQLIGKLQSSGRVVIGATGIVEGEIECRTGDFSGQVNANVKVSELLLLKASVKMVGDISTSKLAVESGAIFTGHCSMEMPKNAPQK